MAPRNNFSPLLFLLALAILSLSACSKQPEGSTAASEAAVEQEEQPPPVAGDYPESREQVPAGAGESAEDTPAEAAPRYEETPPAAEARSREYASEAPAAADAHRESAEEAPLEAAPRYEAAAPAPDAEYRYEETAPVMETGDSHRDMVAAADGDGSETSGQPDGLDKYKVVLAADKQMKLPGEPGELKVWIGSPEYKPSIPSRMAEAETTLPAVGESATVEPYAPSFDVKPAETQCIKIHPTGSEVRFTLRPKNAGTFHVGANVYLFNSLDCSGSPVPKTPASLSVTVQVDQEEVLRGMGEELWKVFWAKLLEFWGALLALIFALFLFLIRGKLKKWFGFKGT
jgi:hypothetical protein